MMCPVLIATSGRFWHAQGRPAARYRGWVSRVCDHRGRSRFERAHSASFEHGPGGTDAAARVEEATAHKGADRAFSEVDQGRSKVRIVLDLHSAAASGSASS